MCLRVMKAKPRVSGTAAAKSFDDGMMHLDGFRAMMNAAGGDGCVETDIDDGSRPSAEAVKLRV
jgi:hypothetical protein